MCSSSSASTGAGKASGRRTRGAARFRPPAGAWIARLPQEDFCQATGIDHAHKYEVDGGPGIPQILRILARAENPQEDRRTFVLAQLAFWMLVAIDGHAKNFSIFHYRGGGYGLTPLYDVLSAWPVIGSGKNKLPPQNVKLAMALHGSGRPHYRLAGIQPRHFEELTASLADPGLWPAMRQRAERVPEAIVRVSEWLPEDFESSVWDSITGGLKRQAYSFLKATGRR